MLPEEEIPLQPLAVGSRPAVSRDVPEGQQNGNAIGWNDTLTAVGQGGGDALQDWQEYGFVRSADEMKRLPAIVNTRLHEALWAEDFEEAIRSTIRDGTSLAELDLAGMTALHRCVVKKLLGPFRVLLSYEGSANLGDADGFPVLNVALLHQWIEGARAALAAGAAVTAYKQTPIHLAVEMDELGLLEEILDKHKGSVDCLNAYGDTALYTAVANNNLPAVKTLLLRGASVNGTHKLLHAAVRHPCILKYILDNTDAVDSLDHKGYAPLHKAVMINCPESVNLLLKRFENPKLKIKDNGMTALHLAALHASNQAAQAILEHDSTTVNELDDNRNTPLAIAADSGNKALIKMLLKKGAVLSAKNNKKKTIIELITSRLLDCSSFFEHVFDELIYTDESKYLTVDYGFLTVVESTSQINVVEEFVRCGQSKILLHPLMESLLYLKWRHLLPVFCMIIGFYSVFIVTFNIFVVYAYYHRDSRNLKSFSGPTELGTPGLYWLMIALIYVSLSAMFGLELFCIYLKRLRYFGHLESWVKLCLLVLGAGVPCAMTIDDSADWLRHATCAALLLGWLQAMFLLARFPYWGNYVLMFGTVAINLLKVLATVIFLVIAFSFCFMIQYRSKSPFDGPIPAFVKTLVMMSSEYDYEDLFGSDHDNELQETRTVVRLLFVLFVIFLAIVLMNFMIGAAVSDIKDLNVTGNIKRLEKQVQLLSILDSLVHSGLLDKIFKKTFSDGRYHKKIRIMCGIQVQWLVECATTRVILLYDSEALFQFHSNTYLLPLHKAFVDIATKKKEVQECKCNSEYSSKIDSVADEGQSEMNRNDSCCSDQINVDRGLLPPQPNAQTDRTCLHTSSTIIEQMTSDMASMKQVTSDLVASIKRLTLEIAKLKKT